MHKGDLIVLKAKRGATTYRVYRMAIVRPSEVCVLRPTKFEQVVLTALRKSPAERFATMNDLDAALTDIRRRHFGPGMTAPMAAPPASPSRFMPIPTTHHQAQGTPMPTPPP